MVQDFEDAVWASEIDTVPTEFIKTQFGYHLLWVHSITLSVKWWAYQDLNLGPSVKRPSIGQTNPYALE